MRSPDKTVVVGMSGGVDSSVAALLLKEQGWRVIGLFMKNWEEEDASGNCLAAEEYEDVKRVAAHIGVPCYSVNFSREYRDRVFARFLKEYEAGLTPNPDVLCNREIKFKALLERALELGADCLATGHYCRNRIVDGEAHLLRGLDPKKDQSYFLCAVENEALKKALFPIGALQKSEVRRIAKESGLPTAEKKDSTGICFIGERNFKEFLGGYLQAQPGDIKTVAGEVIGKHDGVAYYTLGQRKGLRIGGAGEAWFVAEKDSDRNVLIVAQGAEHPALYRGEATATEPSWISPKGAPAFPFHCTAKLRYRQPDQECTILKEEGGRLYIAFDRPQRSVTPRQYIVFYDGELCLGGALIE